MAVDATRACRCSQRRWCGVGGGANVYGQWREETRENVVMAGCSGVKQPRETCALPAGYSRKQGGSPPTKVGRESASSFVSW